MEPRKKKGNRIKHKPPSRIRYEQSHPVVSFRVNQEVYLRLKDLLPKSGKSIADFFWEALSVQGADTNSAHQCGYQKGYQEGYQEAKRSYCVVYRCYVCRQSIEIASANAKAAAAQYLEEHRWGHAACHKGR